jgi:uncharacterized protein (DUF488 family)
LLRKSLASYGVYYVWLGDLLGGLGVVPSYPERVETWEYRVGIGVIVSLASSGLTVCVMCRERYWLNCHRAFIAETLYHVGFDVVHIVDLGHVERHREIGVRPSWLRSPVIV